MRSLTGNRGFDTTLAAGIVILSLLPYFSLIVPWSHWGPWLRTSYRTAHAFRSVNTYGLFVIMTTNRPEIVIEGSNDGHTWRAYEFKWKPGDVHRRSAFVTPHMPRLDWQMWFAALHHPETDEWVDRFLERLQEGSPEVLGLLEHNPFPDAPPRYLRATVYDYRFTDSAERNSTGAWWRREYVGPYGPLLERREPSR